MIINSLVELKFQIVKKIIKIKRWLKNTNEIIILKVKYMAQNLFQNYDIYDNIMLRFIR